jgi:hypothetical protein
LRKILLFHCGIQSCKILSTGTKKPAVVAAGYI